MEWFGTLTPEQQAIQAIVQAGIGTVLAFVMWRLIGLQMAQNKTTAENETARNAQVTMLLQFQAQQNADRQQYALVIQQNTERIEAMRRDMLAEDVRVAERHTGAMTFFKGMVEAVQLHTRDTSDALGAVGEHVTSTVTKDLEAGRQRMLKAVEQVTNKADLEAAVQVSIEHQDRNHLVVVSKLETIDRNVSSLTSTEVTLQRIEEDLRIGNTILDRLEARHNEVSDIREQFNIIAADVVRLRQSIPVIPPPSFDKLASAPAIEKHKTEPIPPMPPLDTPIGDVAQPPSLVITHGEADKHEGEVKG